MHVKIPAYITDDPRIARATMAEVGLYFTALCLATRDTKDGWLHEAELMAVGGTAEMVDSLAHYGLLATDLMYVKPDGWRRPRRSAIPHAVRRAVYERDGNHCVQCGRRDRLSLDHVWPFSRGGSDDPSNLQTLCLPCNWSKGAKV